MMRIKQALHAALGRYNAGNAICSVLTILVFTGCSQTSTPAVSKASVTASMPAAPAAPVVLSSAQLQQFEQAKGQLRRGEASAAVDSFSQLFAQLPQAPGVGYNLAVSQWQSGDVAAAQHTLQQVISVLPHYSDAHNLSGVLARQQGQFRLAERHFHAAVQAQASYSPGHKNLAILYELYLGDAKQAYFHYQQYYTLTQDEQAKAWLALLEQQPEQGNE
jgi:Flp pilus assembly protein TadD